jgi:MoxR-like ATPase
MFKLMVDYPSEDQEAGILQHFAAGRDTRNLDLFDVSTVLGSIDVVAVQEACVKVIVEPSIIRYITALVTRTRKWHAVEVGASPRAGVNMLLAGRALAACRGRDFVVPDDVKQLAPWVLRHRLRLRPDVEIEGVQVDDVIREVLDSVEAPRK